jgi:hypothetical protein
VRLLVEVALGGGGGVFKTARPEGGCVCMWEYRYLRRVSAGVGGGNLWRGWVIFSLPWRQIQQLSPCTEGTSYTISSVLTHILD